MGKESDRDQPAEIVREYGPFPGAPHVNGVSFDGRLVWFAGGAANDRHVDHRLV